MLSDNLDKYTTVLSVRNTIRTAMPFYRLQYFDVRSRGEVIRLLLAYSGKPHEDVKLPYKNEEWYNTIKPTTLFGQLPMLEVDEKRLCQSGAISRYLAKQFGLFGSNDWEEAQIDMIMGCLEDIYSELFVIMLNTDETSKKEQIEAFEKHFPEYLTSLRTMLLNNSHGEYFVGNKLSLADIQFMHFMTFPEQYADVKFPVDDFPDLAALITRVENQPQLKQYLNSRGK